MLAEAEAVASAQCAFVTGTLTIGTEPAALVATLWDLRRWHDRATELLDDLDRLGPRLTAGDHEALAEGFVVSADTLRHMQADPLLPHQLLPAEWPGERLRQTHRQYDRHFKAALADWQRSW